MTNCLKHFETGQASQDSEKNHQGRGDDGSWLGVIILNRNQRTSQYKPTVRQSHFILCRIHEVRFELEVIILNLFKSIVLDIELKTDLGTDHIYIIIYILSRFCLKKSSIFGSENLMSQQKWLFILVLEHHIICSVAILTKYKSKSLKVVFIGKNAIEQT